MGFSAGTESHVEVAVFDLLGQRVQTLISDRRQAGTHQFRWDGRDQTGGHVATGVYLYRLTTTDHILTRKMLLLR
ncbi:MAG TPA: hypothetical protein DIC52_02085 [Candidatus Latescibacteria bacterium]|nr:hypothetical protein [Candidatus Latescibacterota bacterium]